MSEISKNNFKLARTAQRQMCVMIKENEIR